MDTESCITCGKSKSLLCCEVCAATVCKHCAQLIDEDTFSFLETKTAAMHYSIFCTTCFDQNISAELEKYNQTMAAAKEVYVFYKTHSKVTRLIRRDEEPISIIDCDDKEEVILRLAFKAAQMGYNSLIQIEINSKKNRVNNYQSQVYTATGIPAQVDLSRLVKDRSIWSNPN